MKIEISFQSEDIRVRAGLVVYLDVTRFNQRDRHVFRRAYNNARSHFPRFARRRDLDHRQQLRRGKLVDAELA